MSLNRFFVYQDHSSYAPTLLAAGLARLVENIMVQNDAKATVTITDAGSHYVIEPVEPITEEMLDNTRYQMLHPALFQDDLTQFEFSLDLAAEGAKLAQMKEAKDSAERAMVEVSLLYNIASVVKKLDAKSVYGKLISTLHRLRPHYHRIVKCILMGYATPDYSLEETSKNIRDALKVVGLKQVSPASTVQLYNPDRGKGVNAAKQGALSLDTPKGPWFEQWLQHIGLYLCGAYRYVQVNPRTRDIKIYVVKPKHMTLDSWQTTVNEFQRVLSNSSESIKQDIFAILGYVGVLLVHLQSSLGVNVFGISKPTDYVSGLQLAYFKNLGSSEALSNLTLLGLPYWIPVNREALARWRKIIKEMRSVVGSIEETGDTVQLLQQFRNFLSSGDLDQLLAFCLDYSRVLFNQLSLDFQKRQHRFIRPFNEIDLKEVVVAVDSRLKTIVENPGFSNIARAIRSSTIALQYQPKEQRLYKVRYGMVQDIKRKAPYAEEFLSYISEFVAAYNAENARVYETKAKINRHNVSEEDVVDLVKLVDEFGSELVAKLLIACGYARQKRNNEVEVADDEN